MSKYIYFDHAATTPVHRSVVEAMKNFWSRDYGNASSTHQYGQKASASIAESRKLIADFFYCLPEEIIFTSGATESSNLAIKGVMHFYNRKFCAKILDKRPHMIVSAIEHPSVLESALALERDGMAITAIKPSADGVISVDDFIDAIQDDTVLISLMYVNNETGLIQPVQDLGKKLQIINVERASKNLPKIYYHVDAVQAFTCLNCRPDHLKADLMSFSAHKIYGPKGVGFLYIRHKTPLLSLINGGHQERTLRAGTSNTSGIVGLAAAVKYHIQKGKQNQKNIKELSDYLYQGLATINDLRFNSDQVKSVPTIINIALKNISGSDLQMKLDMKGIATSSGAACAAGAVQPSPVLIAMGQTKECAEQGLRISLGEQNTMSEVKRFIRVFINIINEWSHV